MSKGSRGGTSRGGSTRESKRHVRRLERRLTAVRELEAKRRRQAAEARDRAASRDLQSRRLRQLEKARERRAALELELRALVAPAAAAAVVAAAPTPDPAQVAAPARGPQAYCLREKRKVVMADPAPIVMRNGRPATSGTCPSCGSRLTRPS